MKISFALIKWSEIQNLRLFKVIFKVILPTVLPFEREAPAINAVLSSRDSLKAKMHFWGEMERKEFSKQKTKIANENSHFLSFQTCTLIGMLIIPTLLSLKNFWWRFVIVWAIFTSITGFIMKRAMEKPVHFSTPR